MHQIAYDDAISTRAADNRVIGSLISKFHAWRILPQAELEIVAGERLPVRPARQVAADPQSAHKIEICVPATQYPLAPPSFCNDDAIIGRAKRERVARRERVLKIHRTRTRVVPQLGLCHFRDAIVTGTGVVIIQGQAVYETLDDAAAQTATYRLSGVDSDNPVLEWSGSPQKHHLRAPAVLLRKAGDRNYGHFIVELLPKIQLLRQLNISNVTVIIPNDPALYALYRDALAMAGVAEHQLYPAEDDKPIRCDRLIYPMPMTQHPIWKSPLCVSYLEQLQVQALESGTGRIGPKNIFVTREDHCARRLINKREIEACAEAHGFECVATGQMSLAEQMRFFSAATHVAGIFGASMTNMVFAPRNARVTILAPDYVPSVFYWDLACHKNQDYRQLHGPSEGDHQPQDNFSIDVGQFERLLSLGD